MQRDVFYFIAQRGAIANRPMVADNFYQYTIPEIYRGQVLAEVESATLGSAGLEYPVQFLKDLRKWDLQGRGPNPLSRSRKLVINLNLHNNDTLDWQVCDGGKVLAQRKNYPDTDSAYEALGKDVLDACK